ncbi:carboxypeptidase y inhibitor [Fusarium austroafricanum]|uniref:Carboxypeptidase y inhibitor n=1 Tax=Fusarium austroafricanum TaxID=2364996 RepID=A0A8H4NVD3_9HYPO|nr:carboxypeptidase y inhibitor [Fusarium austroafricanum]
MLWQITFLLAAQLGNVIGNDQEVLGPGNRDLDHIREKLVEAEIIPNIIDDFPPALGLRASWKKDSADLGNALKPKHLKKAPKIHLDKVDEDSSFHTKFSEHMSYVVVLTDPDAPSRVDPKWSEFCHWIAIGNRLTPSTMSKHHFKDIIKYKAPAPPPKTGPHRYIFFAFIAANGTTKKLHLSKPNERKHWGSDHAGHGVREWAQENGLIPIAANFIYAENNDQ